MPQRLAGEIRLVFFLYPEPVGVARSLVFQPIPELLDLPGKQPFIVSSKPFVGPSSGRLQVDSAHLPRQTGG